MALEISAGRLLSMLVGTSIYSWAGSIGLILTGMTVGGFLGGYLSERFDPRKLYRLLLALSAISILLIVPTSNVLLAVSAFVTHSLPIYILLTGLTLFVMPVILLSAAAPAVSKQFIQITGSKSKAVGPLFFSGTGGAVLGTLLSGFVLIPWFGNYEAILIVGILVSTLPLIGNPNHFRYLMVPALAISVMLIFARKHEWQDLSGVLGLAAPKEPNLIYSDESLYSLIRIYASSRDRNKRVFCEDLLRHSQIDLANPDDLRYGYERVFADVLRQLHKEETRLKTLSLGGGGYVFPRYLARHYSGEHTVIELDPDVTKAAVQAFGLSETPDFKIIHEGGRRFLNRQGEDKNLYYDYLFVDVFSGFMVPVQFTTLEFFEKCHRILRDDGGLFMNVIDDVSSPRFLASLVETSRKYFPDIKVFGQIIDHGGHNARGTFVLYLSSGKNSVVRKDLGETDDRAVTLWGSERLSKLRTNHPGIILRDSQAPLETLLGNVVQKGFIDYQVDLLRRKGKKFIEAGDFESALESQIKVLALRPESAPAMNNVGMMYIRLGEYEKAIFHLTNAISRETGPAKSYNTIGIAFTKLGRHEEALIFYEDAVRLDANFAEAHNYLGVARYFLGRYTAAERALLRSIRLNPSFAKTYDNLGHVYVKMGDYEHALKCFLRAAELNPNDQAAKVNAEQTEALIKGRAQAQ